MAGAPARAALCASLLRCSAGQGAGRGHGAQQGGPRGARRPARRHQGDFGAVDRADRGRQVGAKFWLRVMSELKNRGVEDVLIAIVDGLKGFPEAITAVFPHTQVPTCIVHLIRNSLEFVSWKERKAVAAALKEIYRATDADAGQRALEAFAASSWGAKDPAIAMAWRRNWAAVIPFFAFPDEVRRIVYTTNAIEALNGKLRRAVRARGHFPTDESAMKLLYLVLNLAAKEWKMAPREWGMARAQLAILFEDRFSLA